jgi:FKBP-type peptidyl-prolyl cis-trans isomerase
MGTDEGRVVAGVDEGLRYMRDGGKAKLLTPSSLAYGFEGIWQIVPGYTPLLWIIDIDSVKAGPGK